LVVPAASGSNTGGRRLPVEMPRYFFHVRRGDVTVFDREGVELIDIAQAAKEAARRGRELAARDAENGASLGPGRIIIEEGWRTVLELPFS
jgi:hypothetical protein